MKDFNIKRLIRDNIKTMKPYASARTDYNDVSENMVCLDANENPFENGINRYPDPQQLKVKAEISKLKGISVHQLLLGNGSDEVLDLIFRAFCEPKKDNIITLPPTYGMYDVLAKLNHIENRRLPLTNQFQPNLELISRSKDYRSKAIFICSPNNPTGNQFSKGKIEKLLREFEGLVVIDEAYIDFSNKESWIKRLDEFPNLIVTQTLSKAYGMAGVRLGICYASEAIITILNKIKPPYNVNTLTQQKVLEKLSEPDRISEDITEILKQRDGLKLELETIPFIEKVYPSDANFLLVKVDDATKRYQELLKKGIVVRNRTNQLLCNNCLRFTIGTESENKKLITVLKLL
ncbi:histidinol-phosphate transaminase [Psychroserpens mesophilus]|uniref:histidinol-phosphate transaminase n=1 Tax=Psychroserpens mesophilus TaxID=325473 RepID=UPI003D64B2DA